MIYDTRHGVVINRAKFDACTSSSLREVKEDRHTQRHKDTQADKTVLYSIDVGVAQRPFFDMFVNFGLKFLVSKKQV